MDIDINNKKIDNNKKRIRTLKKNSLFKNLFKHRYEILIFLLLLFILIFPDISGQFFNHVYRTFISNLLK